MIASALLTMSVMCSWNNPGHDPFTGSIHKAVDNFTIPKSAREEIKYKILVNEPDDIVEFGKYTISSKKYVFNNTLVLMHFGKNKMCWGIDRSMWSNNHIEKAPIYCSSTYCVAVPYVCNNVTQLFSRKDSLPYYEKPVKKEIHAVPEPSTLALLSATLLGVFIRRKKK